MKRSILITTGLLVLGFLGTVAYSFNCGYYSSRCPASGKSFAYYIPATLPTVIYLLRRISARAQGVIIGTSLMVATFVTLITVFTVERISNKGPGSSLEHAFFDKGYPFNVTTSAVRGSPFVRSTQINALEALSNVYLWFIAIFLLLALAKGLTKPKPLNNEMES